MWEINMKMTNTYDHMIVVLTIQSIFEEIEQNTRLAGTETFNEEYLRIFARLSRLSHHDLMIVASGSMSVKLDVNYEEVNRIMSTIEMTKEIHDDFVWCIRFGATNTMLEQMYPTLFDERTVANHRREELEGKVGFKRRTKIKSESTQVLIYELWKNSLKDSSIISRLKHVYFHFAGQYDLGMIYATLSEYYDNQNDILKEV